MTGKHRRLYRKNSDFIQCYRSRKERKEILYEFGCQNKRPIRACILLRLTGRCPDAGRKTRWSHTDRIVRNNRQDKPSTREEVRFTTGIRRIPRICLRRILRYESDVETCATISFTYDAREAVISFERVNGETNDTIAIGTIRTFDENTSLYLMIDAIQPVGEADRIQQRTNGIPSIVIVKFRATKSKNVEKASITTCETILRKTCKTLRDQWTGFERAQATYIQ
jgi:hypothetical protein